MSKISARRDMAIIAAVTLAAAVICVKFNLSEALLAWTRPRERLQLDEVPAVLLVVAVSLVWFSSRRYFEANRQLLWRKAAEARLAEALAQNQRLAQQYVDMQEDERKALARDLHDELGQYLNAMKLDAVAIRQTTPGSAVEHDAASAMIANIDRMYGVVTGLIRQLRPVGLDDLGLTAALEHCVNEWRSRLSSTSIGLSIGGEIENLDAARGLALFRLVQEALTNIARHADATRVDIRIASAEPGASGRIVEILIADDGRGTDMSKPRTGLGLVGMRERIFALGGTIAFESEPGSGFEIRARLPLTATLSGLTSSLRFASSLDE